MFRLLLACAITGLTFGWPRIDLSKRGAPASGSKMMLTPTRVDSARRLGVVPVETHSDRNDPDCIVGGYDDTNPSRVYVGGPCAGLTIDSEGNISLNDDFRWIVMETVWIEITDGDNVAPMEMVNGSEVRQSVDGDTHAEIAVGGSMVVDNENMSHAAVYACTTSYVAKDTIQYNTNSFVIGDNERIDQCVAPCCSDPGDDGCVCTDGCPDEMLEASAGMFKYSIMAASYNWDGSIGGASGNGWERVVEEIGEEGEDGSKMIHGFMYIYQMLDFTNMQADTLTITSSGGATTYSDMGTCNLDTGAGCDANAVEVESMTVASENWTGHYAFPQTYNLGSWSLSQNATVEMTKKVDIVCVKPAFVDGDAKIVLLRYSFDISGITANETSGKFMNYDPVVTTRDSVTPEDSGSTTAAGTTAAGTTAGASDSGTGDSGTDGDDSTSTAGATADDTVPAVDASSAWGAAPGGLLALTVALASA